MEWHTRAVAAYGCETAAVNSVNSMKDSDPLALIGYLSEKLNAFKLAPICV